MASLLKVGDVEVLHLKSTPLNTPEKPTGRYNGFSPSTTILPKGHKLNEDSRPFQVDTIWERDIAIAMRDGVTLHADVFRPANVSEKVPAIIPWSPYGKTGIGYFTLDNIPYRAGVPKLHVSGYEKFEGPDPAEWTQHHYAVVNIDARGAFWSEGDIRYYGSAEGRDGYDAIEHVAKLPWCNGKVATMGNSWLATAQWFIAAERPPSLACILPLEGLSDFYRENFCRGGVPNPAFFGPYMARRLFGKNNIEDVSAMLKKYPLMNEYWADKRAKIQNIQVPAYILASMSTGLHTVGSLRAPIYNIPFSTWPIPETERRCFYLCDGGELTEENPSTGEVSYQSDVVARQMNNDPEEAVFTYTFPERCTLIGPTKAVLYLSCTEFDDMDVFVQIRKADKDGNILVNSNIPLEDLGKTSIDEIPDINVMKYLGPTGILRASHRNIDPILSKPHWPAHDHTKEVKVAPGNIVKLEIGLWPASIQWDAGEKLIFKVAGHPMSLAEFPLLRGTFTTANQGKHVLHLGGDHNSHVEIPVVALQ
ncbi:Alpha/Beta hydrolase protein [Ilyonectria sp. MPI-CAGE-AT-0026]|nr:Alpha/Beta hydrolase protein [Ilyonectria sp. MPI-CAGE-AT-0026]